ncbi:MAG: sigma 54-interacting transcriptional regulator [Candidatus Eisenbacteria bacterium]
MATSKPNGQISGDSSGWVRLLLDAAKSHLRSGEAEAACECAERAVGIASEAAESDVIIQALSILAEGHDAAGRRAKAREILEDCTARCLAEGRELEAAEFEACIGRAYRQDSRFAEARDHLLRSLRLSARSEPGAVRALALEELGPIERRLGMPREALDHLTEALRIRESLKDRKRVAAGHDRIGNIHVRLGELDEAVRHYERSLVIYQELEDRNGTAIVSNNLGAVHLQRGDYEAALSSFQRARDLAEDVGDQRALAWATGNLGLAHTYLGNMVEAEPALLASIDALAQQGDLAGQAIYANNLALVYLTSARYEESISWGKQSAAYMKELGNVEGATKPWLNVARANLELGRIEEAERAAEEAKRLSSSSESGEIQSEELILEASLCLARGEAERARDLATRAAESASAGNALRQRAESLRLLGGSEVLVGDLDAARDALTESESLFVQLRDVYDLALVRVELGALFLRIEAYDAALRRVRQAQEVFQRLRHAPHLCRSWILMAEVDAARGGGDVEGYLENAREAAEGAERVDLVAEVDAARTRIVERPWWSDGATGSGSELGGVERACLLELVGGLRELGVGETWLALLGARIRLDGAALLLDDGRTSVWAWGRSDELLERARVRHASAIASGVTSGPTSRMASGVGRIDALSRSVSDGRESIFAPIARPAASPQLDAEGREGAEGAGPYESGPRGLLCVTRTLGSVPGAPMNGAGLEQLLPVLAEVLSLLPTQREIANVVLPETAPFEGIVGESSEMRAIFRAVERVAPSDASVLVLGESGTGKELVARAIHERSDRKGKPFVAISCPSIPRELIEAELFGHEKGAFTGAAMERRGQVEAADGGTLFLDEIGDMDLATQTKLLRFLQEREFLRVGGREPIRVDIRVLAATSRYLEAEIAAGRFRLDLYYRIGVVPLKIPPLRERIQDVPPLVAHFLHSIGSGDVPPIDRAVIDALSSYSWPGNVRELRNVVEYVLAMHGAEGPVTPADLPARVREALDHSDGAVSLSLRRGETLEARLLSVEGAILRRTLDACGWNQTRAARRLGLKESTMRYKMRRFDLRRPGDGRTTDTRSRNANGAGRRAGETDGETRRKPRSRARSKAGSTTRRAGSAHGPSSDWIH